jgi:hypothetical protein
VALADLEVVEGERLLASRSSATGEATRSP